MWFGSVVASAWEGHPIHLTHHPLTAHHPQPHPRPHPGSAWVSCLWSAETPRAPHLSPPLEINNSHNQIKVVGFDFDLSDEFIRFSP